jgi:hypothetical protein
MKPSEIEITKKTETHTFKARFKASRARFIRKVCQHKVDIKDNYSGRFWSSIYVYLPKLTPRYIKPSIMLTIITGNSSTTIRTDDIQKVVKALSELTNYLTSNAVAENWERLTSISDQLNENTILVLDDKFIDRKAFNKVEIQD